ncbi:hypothetical protein K458DRAFT_34033 [Lentithecium fluviatile CBS 122367]|uniref:Uncharacterized protein n=1 Tax=Lentithecium fluviatile CBS 122367 TaxID=1168545 RepID=A0A6G1J381_9PLEO|nr:hypothetical protein K458DRAFT_34033 [Lentithecium fluviatile CBS 122367]
MLPIPRRPIRSKRPSTMQMPKHYRSCYPFQIIYLHSLRTTSARTMSIKDRLPRIQSMQAFHLRPT